MKKVAVIGYPVKHSLSPKLHGYWLQRYSILGEYGMFEVKPEEFEKTISSLFEKGYVGMNITVPFKEKAFLVADYVDEVAKNIGAANTLILDNNKKIKATNTDAFGFIENIKQSINYNFIDKNILVLGAGGAAKAVVYGLIKEQVAKIFICNRSIDKAHKIKANYSDKVEVITWDKKEEYLKYCDLLVNTTILGMENCSKLELRLDNLKPATVVTDLVYKPLHTNLLLEAKQRGNIIVDGLGMLLYQAVPGFTAWFGQKPEVDNNLKEYILNL